MSMRPFAALKALRDTLANIPVFSVDAEARVVLVASIDALDEAMVAEQRAVMGDRAKAHVADTAVPDFASGLKQFMVDLTAARCGVLERVS